MIFGGFVMNYELLLRDKLMRKINFQIWKMNVLKEYEDISIVIDSSLREVFLNNVDYYFSEIKKQVSYSYIDYEIFNDLALRCILLIKFFY